MWDLNNASFSNVIQKSQEHINASPIVGMYKEYALWLKEQDGDKEIPLRYAAFKEFQDQSDDVAKKYKDLNKSQDSMAVWALKVQLVDFKTDTVKKADYQRWFKGLSKDLYLQEAVNVATEIK